MGVLLIVSEDKRDDRTSSGQTGAPARAVRMGAMDELSGYPTLLRDGRARASTDRTGLGG